jgi:hypothetical protein
MPYDALAIAVSLLVMAAMIVTGFVLGVGYASDRHEGEVKFLRKMLLGMARRVCAQSELLTRRAAKHRDDPSCPTSLQTGTPPPSPG